MSEIKKYFTEQADNGSWLVREQLFLPHEELRIITIFADLSEERAKEIVEALNE